MEKVMRKTAKIELDIGCSPCFTPMIPKRKEDAELALKYNFTPNGEFYDGCFFTDALIKGEFTEEYKKWFKINCETNHICRKCIFGCVDCDDLSLRCWIHHKDLYSDKFLDQEIEVE